MSKKKESLNNTVATSPSQSMQLFKVYTKDISFEVPNAPRIFAMQGEGKASVEMNMKSVATGQADTYEVSLRMKVTFKVGDTTGFICELEQAGLVAVQGIDNEASEAALKQACFVLLLPYVQEATASLCVRGGFPPLHIPFPEQSDTENETELKTN